MAGTLELEGEEREKKLGELFGNWVEDHTADGEPDADAQATMRLFRRVKSRRRNPLVAVADGVVQRTSLIADLRATPATLDAELRSLQIPVLALYGEQSELRPEGERVAGLAPHATLELVPGATHGLIWQATSLLRERLGAWVDERRATRP
jgi:pimeloyl-ACP methyl ester carboxylesterase